MQAPISGIILAGGNSTRMGRNKALLEIDGLPIVERAAGVLSNVCSEIIIAGGNMDFTDCRIYRHVPDIYPGCGPLSGIHAGLTAACNYYCFVCACDMPFPDVALIKRIIAEREDYDVVVLKAGEYLEPLFSLYSKGFIPAIETSIKQGVNKVTAALSLARCKQLELDQRSIPGLSKSLININTPQDYEEAVKAALPEKITRRDK